MVLGLCWANTSHSCQPGWPGPTARQRCTCKFLERTPPAERESPAPAAAQARSPRTRCASSPASRHPSGDGESAASQRRTSPPPNSRPQQAGGKWRRPWRRWCRSGLPRSPASWGIDEAGRGPVLGPMVYGCMYSCCFGSYNNTLATLKFADSKTLKEEQREELFESLKVNNSIGWEVDVICPKDLSAKMLKKSKVNLNEISHNSAMCLVRKVLDMGVLLAEVYIDTVGDPEKYRIKLTEKFPGIKFVVAKKADSLYPVVSGASIVAMVTRDRALRNWVFDETALSLHMKTGSGYPGDPDTKQWLEDHKHPVFGFPTLVRFSWGTCKPFFKDAVEVTWESDEVDEVDEDGTDNGSTKRQVKLCFRLYWFQKED
ncbi:unnamed protein product [Miscanthus lutarioriparius]|uniref:Ribonuclease n=1 Tax=Miscanthus lutarioriparius TaxID=422564 RepID=A0A811RL28_9POAL|nr:unnamed protein product [Miscanthus lutarioriparius]